MSIDWTFITGLVLGILIGCFSSYYLWIIQINHRRRNVASALKIDIMRLHKKIQPIAYLEKIVQAHSFGGDNSSFILPIYEQIDLFYTLKTDVNFNELLNEKIFEFYKTVIDAEKYRQLIIEKHDIRFDNELIECLSSIIRLTWEIVPLLDKEIQWNIFKLHI